MKQAVMPDAARYVALDGVRGLAILLVLAHQLVVDGGPDNRWWRMVLVPMEAGWIGVQLFFVLSGFLITRILVTTRSSENYWQSFYMRRSLRIFPLYYLLLIGMFWGVSMLESVPPGFVVEPQDRVWFWTYTSNWAPLFEASVGALGHCWSLAVEEQFYLVWPLVVRWLRGRQLARLCYVLVFGALALRVVLLATRTSAGVIYSNTFTRVDALAFGALAALAFDGELRLPWFEAAQRHFTSLAALTLGLAVVSGGYSRANPITLSIGHTVLAATSAVAIVGVARRDRAAQSSRLLSVLRGRLLGLLGKHSYAIYLIHLPIHVWLCWALLGDWIAQAEPMKAIAIQVFYWLAGPLGLLAVARLIYVLVEGPVLDLKRHFAVKPGSSVQ